MAARSASRGRRERDHQPSAQPLHLVAAVGGGGLGQQVVVGPGQALGLVVVRLRIDVGEVAEQDGDQAHL